MRSLALILALSAAAAAQETKRPFWMGKRLPPLRAPKQNWVNADEPPTRTGLRGKVLWLQFTFLNCKACRKFESDLVRWDSQWREKGLRILEIDDGRIDPFDAVRSRTRRTEKKFPVLWDEKGELTRKYRVRGYPTGMLVAADGTIVWVGYPTQWKKQVEARIAAELKKLQLRRAAEAADPDAARTEPLWLTERAALAEAREDGKWVLYFRYSPAVPGAKSFLRKTLGGPAVVAYLTKNLHCIISDDPGASVRAREPRLWKRSAIWDKSKYLWLLHPKSGKRVALDFLEKGRPIGPAALLEVLRKKTAGP